MLFLLQHQDYISWFHAWCLVSFPSERDLLSVPHAFVHMHLQKLSLLRHLMTLTLSAAVLLIYHLTCTSAQTKIGEFKVLFCSWLYITAPICGCSEYITFSIAVCADWLHLLDHPRGQLSEHDSHASSSTCHTLLHCSCLTPLTTQQTCMCSVISRKKNMTNHHQFGLYINMLFLIMRPKL